LAIASTKTTVLGVRLDHDRRAWVEAEAARRGVTVRVLIEEMIDQSREEEEPQPSEADRPAEAVVTEVGPEERTLCDDIAGLATMPVRMMQAAVSTGISIARRACIVRGSR
jgi:hypothetical protein